MRIRDHCADEGVVQNYWGEGIVQEPEELLEFKVEASPKVLVVQDPDLAKIGPELCKTFAHEHDITLTLGIGADVMTMMTPDEIGERVQIPEELIPADARVEIDAKRAAGYFTGSGAARGEGE